jgi:II/X family phage/plasmid replication protein
LRFLSEIGGFVVIDLLALNIPFKVDYYSNDPFSEDRFFLNSEVLEDSGVSIAARSISRGASGAAKIDSLMHPYESLPSSFGSMAMKIVDRPVNDVPHVLIKASPAKLLQGHNIYGSEDPRVGGFEMFGLLLESYPVLFDMLDVQKAELMQIDYTYSIRAKSQRLVEEFVKAAGSVSNGQTKSRNGYETTAYFGAKNSRHKRLKVYAKFNEVAKQIADLWPKRTQKGDYRLGEYSSNALIALMQNRQFSQGLARFEASLFRRTFQKRGIPTNFIEFCRYSVEWSKNQSEPLSRVLWREAWKDVFKAFEGVNMAKYDDDQILEQIKAKHVRYSEKTGKPSYSAAMSVYRTFLNIRSEGYDSVSQTMAKRTFQLHIKMLSECGFAKSYLQNLGGAKKAHVIPMVNVLNFDFDSQRPAGWVEPKNSAVVQRLFALSPSQAA